jgi:hypothetical protein
MSGIDINPYYAPGRASVNLGSNRSQGFSQNDISSAMQKSGGLSISLNWHCCNKSIFRCFNYFNTHFGTKVAVAALPNYCQ